MKLLLSSSLALALFFTFALGSGVIQLPSSSDGPVACDDCDKHKKKDDDKKDDDKKDGELLLA